MKAEARRVDWRRLGLFFSAVAVLTLAGVSLPQAGPPFDIDVDTSLSAMLHYAHLHHLQYGTDVVFTYGPLGFLTFFYYYPDAFAAQVFAHFILCFAAASSLCLIAARLPRIWGLLLALTFVWVTSNASPRTDVIINIALFCWSLLCFIESGRRLTFCTLVLGILAAFTGLMKISFLILGSVSIVLLTMNMFIRRDRKPGVCLLASSLITFFVGWILAGQQVGHLGPFLRNSLAAVHSYSSAMGWEGADSLRFRGILWAILAIPLVLGTAVTSFEGNLRQTKIRRGLVLVWALFFLFSSWKHGFLRVDRFHLVTAASFAPVAALALLALPTGSRIRWLISVFSLACWLLPILILHQYYLPAWWPSIKQPFASIADHLSCLIMPHNYHQRLNASFDVNCRAAQLPFCRERVGNGSVDVFGQDGGYAIVNGLNYDPRPVFQSYFTATARLGTLNEQFYLSSRRPEFVLFHLGALDRKISALEDSRALVHLLCNCQLFGLEDHFLLLQAKTAPDPIRRSFLAEGTVQPGQAIDLRPYQDTNVWLEIVFHPSLMGRLRQWLYRPATLRLAAWHEPGRNRIIRNRAPASMLEAGFLASPLLNNDNDVLDVYNRSALVRPGAYTIEVLPGEDYLWASKALWRAYRIENQFPARTP